jgi:hypothetical protein
VAAGTENWTCTSCKTSYTPTWDPDLEDYVDLPAFSSFGGQAGDIDLCEDCYDGDPELGEEFM